MTPRVAPRVAAETEVEVQAVRAASREIAIGKGAVAKTLAMEPQKVPQAAGAPLKVTSSLAHLSECDHMLLYLTTQTWTRGEASEAFAAEVAQAMDLGVHVLLAHEMPGTDPLEARNACEFDTFFSCPEGATPSELLLRGIYNSEVAVPLKAAEWREVSMIQLAMAFGMRPEGKPGRRRESSSEEAAEADDSIVGLGIGSSIRSLSRTLRSVSKGSNPMPGVRHRLRATPTPCTSVAGDSLGNASTADEAEAADVPSLWI